MNSQIIQEKIEEACKKISLKKEDLRINIQKQPTSKRVYGSYTAEIYRIDKRYPEMVGISFSGTNLSSSQYEEIASYIRQNDVQKNFKAVKFAFPVFINFFLSENCLQKEIKKVLEKRERYGNLDDGNGKKINVEFISANPTGPLTLGNARGGFWGDVLANVLVKAGFRVEKAYYINDYGNQIMALGHSVLKDEEAKYQGDYIDWLNREIKEKDIYKAGEKAAKLIMERLIKKTVKRMGIKFDVWISENWLHRTGRVKKAMAILKKKKFLYEKDQALWFKSSVFGDQRDRVVIKKNDWYTYLAGDAGLHYYKFIEKKFSKVINIWGADHWGDVPGLMGIVEALGHKGKLKILIHQFVTLFQGGKELRMSKRAGVYVTMGELLDMAELDAIRFFFLQKSANTHFNFDIDLAKEQSEKNPVFYVQYAYARICSILKKADIKYKTQNIKEDLLDDFSELELMEGFLEFKESIIDTAKDYRVHRLPAYALNFATIFNQFYRDCKVITDDKELTVARLGLISAAKIVLKNTLDLMGVSAPEKM